MSDSCQVPHSVFNSTVNLDSQPTAPSLPITAKAVGHVTGSRSSVALPKALAALAHVLINQAHGYLLKPTYSAILTFLPKLSIPRRP